jgi:hypothetical protein
VIPAETKGTISVSDENDLRARRKNLSGPARARPLLELTQKLADRYMRIGPGKPAALPVLDEAIVAIDEAYAYFVPGDALRPAVAGTRGWLHGTRHLAHLGAGDDLAIGIEQLEEGLRSPGLAPMMFAMCQITLGQLYMSGVSRFLQSPDISARIISGDIPASAAGEVDRAAACFESVAGSTTVPPEARQAAQILIRMCGALRTIVTPANPGDGVVALNRVMDAMAVLREIHEEQSALLTVPGAVGSFYNAEKLADQPLIDRPVAFVEYDDGPSTEQPAPTRPSPSRDPDQPARARRELRALVSAGGDLFEALEALLHPGAAPPRAGMVDEMVALATEVADAGATRPVDDLLLAAALCLRTGVAGGNGLRRDLDEAVEALLRAASAPRPPTPEALRVMRRIAAVADSALPSGRAGERLSYVLDGRIRKGR